MCLLIIPVIIDPVANAIVMCCLAMFCGFQTSCVKRCCAVHCALAHCRALRNQGLYYNAQEGVE